MAHTIYLMILMRDAYREPLLFIKLSNALYICVGTAPVKIVQPSHTQVYNVSCSRAIDYVDSSSGVLNPIPQCGRW